MKFMINDRPYETEVDVRTSLLDLLRNHLQLTGSEKLRSAARESANLVMHLI